MSAGKSTHKRNKSNGWLQLTVVVLLIGGAFLLSRILSSLQMEPEIETTAGELELVVQAVAVEPQSYRLRFSTTGTAQVRAYAEIVPQVSGRIVAIDDNAFAGGMFTADTGLFRIDKKDYNLALKQARAEVTRARAEFLLQKARSATAAAEWSELHPEQPVPPLVGEEPQLEAARSALDAAQSQLERARLDLSRTEYRLPFTGRISEFDAEVGQYVVAGQPYGRAYGLESIEIVVPLEEQQLAWLLESEEPVITVTGEYLEEATIPAFVKRVGSDLDPQTRMNRIFLGLKKQDVALVPDVFVSVEFMGPTRDNVWLLPLDALQQDSSVWTVTPENRLRLLKLTIIQITREAVVAESNGSTIKVVRGNLPEATDGTPVRMKNKKEHREANDGRQE